MSDLKKTIVWTVLGVSICTLLVPLITETRGMQTYLNLASFLLIYAAGVVLLTLLISLVRRDLFRPISNYWAPILISSKTMIAFMIGFGLYWYDFSVARSHSYFSDYAYTYTLPTIRTDGWWIGEAASEGISQQRLKTIVERFVNDPDFKWQHSFVLIKNNRVIVEEYFYEHTIDSLHDLRSANKSITSILVGIAIQQGFFTSVKDPIAMYLPEYADIFKSDPPKATITLEHLLTMQSGLDANDWDKRSPGNENRLYQSGEDWVRQLFSLKLINKPGQQFSYSSIGEIALRQAIVNASGMPLDEFAKVYLFEHLGIKNYKWTHRLEGRPDVPYRIQLTSRDLGKLGQLYLDMGSWEGRQIVSPDWVIRSTDTHTKTTEKRLGFPNYGYLWWKHGFKVGDVLFESFQAQGSGGQFLFVIPELNTIAVFTSRNFGRSRQINPLKIMRNEIVPMLAKHLVDHS
ncbi:serine hydrolase domain-containing protein [Pseudovibrio sp. W64]|uniref:serine hydrolase domain-containing protein n=1 Tax=Pseudovibrio sp. W64 TaxID=1735583 RepID=UPI00187C401B|nr:serine hydrolase [Pseudovibrio sp. W64]